MLMIITAELVVAVVMVVMVVIRKRMGMNSVIRTDKLGESREEAKKFLEEVEAMEREAHQVVVVVIGITIIRGTTHTHTHTHTHTLSTSSHLHHCNMVVGVRQMYEGSEGLPGSRYKKESSQVIIYLFYLPIKQSI